MMSVLLIITSVAVENFGAKSVLPRVILNRSDIAVWFLHSIFPEHLRACKMSACELFVLCWPHAKLAHLGHASSFFFMETN